MCAAYSALGGVKFGKPDAGLGGARTAPMPGGGMVGVRAPMRETEEPIVRPYWLVDDIKAAVAAPQKTGGQLAVEPTEIPGQRRFCDLRPRRRGSWVVGEVEAGRRSTFFFAASISSECSCDEA